MRLTLLIIVAALSCLCPFRAPAQDRPQWFKGNLHTHSLWSDGNDFPDMIADWYASHGYHFLAISDHNILSEGEKWMNLRDINRRGGALALGKYIERFGDKWVEQRGEGDQKEVRLKNLDEVRKLLQKPGQFILIQGEEITDRFEKLPVHINATNIQVLIKPRGGESVRDVMRRNLEAVRKQSEETGQPILPHLNHPNFGWGVTAEDLAAVTEEQFFEVYNGHPGVRHLGDKDHPGVERIWDIANTIRLAHLKAAPLYGIGTDDSHNYHQRGGEANAMRRSEPGRAWVMVRASKLDTKLLLNAMFNGDFYASSGVTLKDVRYDAEKRRLHVAIDPQRGATYTIRFIGTPADFHGETEDPTPDKVRHSPLVGKTLKEVTGVAGSYQLTGKELYVRAVVISSQPCPNPSYAGQMQTAWTQPVGWEGRVDKTSAEAE